MALSRLALLGLIAVAGVAVFSPRAVAQPEPPTPGLASAYLDEAKSLFRSNNLTAAVEKAKLACQVDPSSPDTFKWLGFFLAKQENKEEAIQALAKAVELGENSSYSRNLLESLLFTGQFPRWLDPRSLRYLPITFESLHFGLSDFRLPQSEMRGLDGIQTTSLIYPPAVPMSGPGDHGRFNRVCYVFALNQETLNYELYLRLAYGSPLLWNLDWEAGPALKAIVPAACSLLLYARAYLPEDALPVLETPIDFWLYPEPGEDSWGKQGVCLYDVISPREEIDWYKRIYGLMGARLLFGQLRSPNSQEVGEAATRLAAFWSLLNSRPGPTPTPLALTTLQEEALACLNHFLQNFSPQRLQSEGDQPLYWGALLYLCSAYPPDAVVQALSSFGTQGPGSVLQLAQPSFHFVRMVLDPLLRFNAPDLVPQDFVARNPDEGIALPSGSTHEYWLSLPEGRWQVDLVAKAGSESALTTLLDDKPVAQTAVAGDEWKRFRTEVQITQPGWHSLQISVPADVQTLRLKSLELRRVGG